MRTISIAAVLLIAGCGSQELSCGDGTDPQVVTGLSGVLDDGRPAVEIQLRVPMDCTLLDSEWMFWDESTDTVTLGEEPTSGSIDRSGIDAGEFTIAFRNLNLGVRLDYPGAEIGPAVSLVWFSSGMDIAFVDCTQSDMDALACAVRPP